MIRNEEGFKCSQCSYQAKTKEEIDKLEDYKITR